MTEGAEVEQGAETEQKIEVEQRAEVERSAGATQGAEPAADGLLVTAKNLCKQKTSL